MKISELQNLKLVSTLHHGITIRFISKDSEEQIINLLLKEKKINHFLNEVDAPVFISSKLINKYRYINRYFYAINEQLIDNECFIGHFETFSARTRRIKSYKIPIIKHLLLFFDFIINRILPKIKYLNNLYFYFNKGRNRVLSKAEVLGRLVCCGFDILEVENIDHFCYFKVRKSTEIPLNRSSSYGFIFKMARVGKNGKLFNVYKFRTMHPFSEYLQEYMVKEHGLGPKGKIDRDFRVTPWGKWMRKYWLDELPQLFNVVLGQMKLVGVRPVSEVYFNKLPKELQQLRVKRRPGCIPPYVAMNRNSDLEGVLDAEKEYLSEKDKHPYTTDFKYFFFAVFNVLFRGKRSA